jgi:hypothetical protein
MTVEELITLTEALIGRDKTVRRVIGEWPELTDDEVALLVRFAAGERPIVPQPTVTGPSVSLQGLQAAFEGRPGRVYRDPGQMPEDWEEDDTEFIERPVRQDPDRPLELRGEFDGIELP